MAGLHLGALCLSAHAAEIIERILAVVDGRPVLLSEVRFRAELRREAPPAALEALIDETLMFREASRLAQAAVTEGEVQRAYDALRPRVAAQGAAVDAEVRRLVRREVAILKYVDFRFRPQVRVSDDAVRAAWEAEAAAQPDPAPLADREEELRARVAARDLDERIEAWVRELRAEAEIRYNPPEPPPSPAMP